MNRGKIMARTRLHAIAMLTMLCLCALPGLPVLPGSAAADDTQHRLHWNSDWPEFQPVGYVLTAGSVLAALGVTVLFDYPSTPRWSGGILLDDAARHAWRARDPHVRDAIRLASDITLISSVLQVALVDSVIMPLADRSPRIAAQLSLINAQAFALDILVSTIIFKAVARERPLGLDCTDDPDIDPLCNVGRYASFPSSHTSTAFTAAGLSCMHHGHLPLYGGPWDVVACLETLAVATATGLFRIIGDRHYLSDVLLGAAIGFTIGYVYPWLLHYRGGAQPAEARGLDEQLRSPGFGTTRWSGGGGMSAPPYGLSFSGVL